MADDIKIRVGVQNNVKAGMGDIVKSIRAQGDDMGRGFGAAFKQAASGNITGAINAILGGAVAGAALAGWQAGKMIDETFGISDKIANAWNKAATVAGKAWDAFYKQLRKNREDAEKDYKAMVEADQKLFEMREKRQVKTMTPQEKVKYAEDAVVMASNAVDATGITEEERGQRKIALEEALNDYEDAQAEMVEAQNKRIKETGDAEAKSLADGAQAAKEAAQARYEFANSAIEAQRDLEEKEKERQIKGLEDITEARSDAIKKAQDDLKKAQDMADILADPEKAKDFGKQEKEKERDRRRRERLDKEMEGRIGRGVTGKSIDNWLDMKAAERKADEAKKQLDALSKQQAADIAAIRKMQEQLLTMK